MAIESILSTAGSRSSKVAATSAGVAVQAEGELGHVVGADGEPVEVLEELVGEDGVGGQLAHHDDAQPVLAAAQAVLGEQVDDGVRFAERCGRTAP